MNRDSIFARQLDILSPEKCEQKITVIGAGATGSFTTLSLAKMGFNNITVYDQDKIEEHNFPNQLYPFSMLGKSKVLALESVVHAFTNVKIRPIQTFYTNQPLEGIVISALDSMKGRKDIYNNCKDNKKVPLLIDPRCGAEMFRVLICELGIDLSKEKYEKTLYSDEEAEQVPCTARSIIYSVLCVSAYICNVVKRYTMNQSRKRDIFIDMTHNFSYFD